MESLEIAIEEIKEKMPKLRMAENEQMREHCSFRVGGPVRIFTEPKDIWEMTRLCSILHDNDVMPLMLGNGTNVIIPDEGLDIAVISTEGLGKIRLGETDDTIYAEAGVSLAKLAQFAQQNGLAGLEFASGIPGTVGGGVLMNAGAYGGEMKDVVESVVVYHLPDQSLCECGNSDCAFSYRNSFFQKVSCIILSAVFRLRKDDPAAISARMHELNEKRRNSQPLNVPSAGSAFKRPVGGYAAALIEQAGLKGYSVGGAQVSEKHSGFVINTGNASYDDVVALMDHVRREVYAKSGITLEPEIRIYPKGMMLVDDWRIRTMNMMKLMKESAQEKAENGSEQ